MKSRQRISPRFVSPALAPQHSRRVTVLLALSDSATRQTVVSVLDSMGLPHRSPDHYEETSHLLLTRAADIAVVSLSCLQPTSTGILGSLTRRCRKGSILLVAEGPEEAGRAGAEIGGGILHIFFAPPTAAEFRGFLEVALGRLEPAAHGP